MEPDWSSPDFAFLRSKLGRGEVTFFAGAGFSFDARNHLGKSPPLGASLAALLAKEAGTPFADDPLPLVYEAAIRTIGSAKIWDFLRTQYSIRDFDKWYLTFSSITWRRIFTLNIDNLIQRIYGNKAEQTLKTIVCPSPPSSLFGVRCLGSDRFRIFSAQAKGTFQCREISPRVRFALEQSGESRRQVRDALGAGEAKDRHQLGAGGLGMVLRQVGEGSAGR